MRRKRKSEAQHKSAIGLRFVQTPNPLSHLTQEEKAKVIAHLGEQYREEFDLSFRKIFEILENANPLQVLAHFAFYDLMVLERDVDTGPDYKAVQQAHVELLQAFILSLPAESGKTEPPRPKVLMELNRHLNTMFSAFGLRRLREKGAGDEAVLPIEQIRAHTQAIRNWGYPNQIYAFLTGLFEPLDEEVHQRFGVRPTKMVEMVQRVIKIVEDRLHARRLQIRPVAKANSVEKAVRAYHEMLGDSEVQRMLDLCRSHQYSLDETKSLLLSHYDLDLWRSYCLSLADFVAAYPEPMTTEAMQRLLNLWSFKPADLQSHNREHFFLNNPIWKRPVIQIGDELYFWPMLQMFLSFGLEMIEQLLSEDPRLAKRYEQMIRPKFLEDTVEELMRKHLSSSTVLRGSLWTDPITGKEFENDILVVLDSFLLVIECKSAGVPPSARRGGRRLEEAIKTLIVAPAEQSARFAEYLSNNRRRHVFRTREGSENHCDTTKVRHVIRLSVTLEFFGPLCCQSRLLLNTGMLEKHVSPAVTMCFMDLENLFDVLEGVHQKLHYLSRRVEWEAHVDYMADEYDLLAFYLATGFNVGTFEFGETNMQIYGLGNALNPYFLSKIGGPPATKPKLRLTQWWRDILHAAEERRFESWTDVGVFLLSADYDTQRDFESRVKKMVRNVKSNWHRPGHENTLILITGPEQRKKAITAYAYKGVSREERDRTVRSIFTQVADQSGCKNALLIGLSADQRFYPYQLISIAFGIGEEPETCNERDGQ